MIGKAVEGTRIANTKIGRRVYAPLVALTMATLFFVYSRSTVYAAKRSAKNHREADGGQISWRNESLRRHGKLKAPEEQWTLRQFVTPPEREQSKPGQKILPVSKEEESIRANRIDSKKNKNS